METITDINFKNTYLPLVEKFIQQIEGIPKENLPEPFIPVYGNLYDQSLFKIAFVGWETRDNQTLQNFYDNFKSDPIDCLFRFKEDLLMDDARNFKFNYYGNNFGRGFWDFILRFLARFYCIHNCCNIFDLLFRYFSQIRIASIKKDAVKIKPGGFIDIAAIVL